eukprot:scaffold128027_cov31-Tisochrysis_lutea.AAC.1
MPVLRPAPGPQVGMTVACLAESQNRANFRSSRVLLEEEGVKVSIKPRTLQRKQSAVALRDGVHRLLLNTLPAPIVRDIASGLTQARTACTHRPPHVQGVHPVAEAWECPWCASKHPSHPTFGRLCDSGRLASQVAHRYDEVTVLQADMVGFTNLSAQRSAEYVLGLLSDLFDKFDALTEEHKTHKVRPPHS